VIAQEKVLGLINKPINRGLPIAEAALSGKQFDPFRKLVESEFGKCGSGTGVETAVCNSAAIGGPRTGLEYTMHTRTCEFNERCRWIDGYDFILPG